MKGKLTFFSILVFLFAIFVFVKFFILQRQSVYGKIKVISSPTAEVFIDNIDIGKTPFEDKYKVGEYFLKLIPAGTATDTASWQGKIKIYKNSLTYVNRELGASDITSGGEIFFVSKMEKTTKPNSGEIYVETDPQGAIVYLDNEEKGVAPLVMIDVLKGDHELSVFMPNFFRRNQKINVDQGFRVNAIFKLAYDQSQKLPGIPNDNKKTATDSANLKKTQVLIKDTPTGWLRVREEPTVDATEAAKVNPGQRFDLIEEQEGWYKIEYTIGKTGWVYSEYANKED